MQLVRNFLREEQQPGQRLTLILSHGLWVRLFGADPHILGRVLRLSGYNVTVVGVLPPDFKPLLKATSELNPEIYYPLALDGRAACRYCEPVHLIGRLRRGVALPEAGAELDSIFQSIVRETPEAHLRGARLAVAPLTDQLIGRASTALWVVWCSAGFILLLACANVANLLLARATGRTREIAIRTARGAGRARLIRQLSTEGLVLAFRGGLSGRGWPFAARARWHRSRPNAFPGRKRRTWMPQCWLLHSARRCSPDCYVAWPRLGGHPASI